MNIFKKKLIDDYDCVNFFDCRINIFSLFNRSFKWRAAEKYCCKLH